MTQNSSSATQQWIGTEIVAVAPMRWKKRRSVLLKRNTPITADDVADAKEIAFGIIGFADVRRSDVPGYIHLVFADPKVSDADINVLVDEFLREAQRHCCKLSPCDEHAEPPVVMAMAVHSDVKAPGR